MRIINQIHSFGATVSIYDFGNKSTNLSLLSKLEIDEITINYSLLSHHQKSNENEIYQNLFRLVDQFQ